MVGEYFVKTCASYRQISKEFSISLPTVKDNIYKYKSLHPLETKNNYEYN